ncbi:hypothetical protein Dimus_013628, partial [Dionaea muscipula]
MGDVRALADEVVIGRRPLVGDQLGTSSSAIWDAGEASYAQPGAVLGGRGWFADAVVFRWWSWCFSELRGSPESGHLRLCRATRRSC